MKEYFGEGHEIERQKKYKWLSQSIDNASKIKSSFKDFDVHKTQQAFRFEIETTNQSYSMTRNLHRPSKTNYSISKRIAFQQSKQSALEMDKSLENKSCVAWIANSNVLKTSTKATLTNKSFFKTENEHQNSLNTRIHNIEKWLDQQELNLDKQWKVGLHNRNVSVRMQHQTLENKRNENKFIKISQKLEYDQKYLNQQKFTILSEWCWQIKDLISTNLGVDLKVLERAIMSFENLFNNVNKSYDAKLKQYEVKFSILHKTTKKLE